MMDVRRLVVARIVIFYPNLLPTSSLKDRARAKVKDVGSTSTGQQKVAMNDPKTRGHRIESVGDRRQSARSGHDPWKDDLADARDHREQWRGRRFGGLVAHFGLGDSATVDTLRIEWPSGIVQELNNVEVNQHLQVVETQGLNLPLPEPLSIQSSELDADVGSWWSGNPGERRGPVFTFLLLPTSSCRRPAKAKDVW